MPRLLIGSFPPPAALARIQAIAQDLRGRLPAVLGSWVAPQHMHITFQFLGEVPANRIRALDKSLAIIAGDHRATTVSLTGLGAFPNLPRANSLNVTVEEFQGLRSLITAIQTATTTLGLTAVDRKPFQPHLTLVRPKRPLQLDEIKQISIFSYQPSSLPINNFSLVESVLGPHGPTYTERSRYELESTN